MVRHRVAAFGSSRLPETDPRFADVVTLGEQLAKNGWDAITGGHQGMMAAFNQGISRGNGHVRGITLDRFPAPPDNHLNEEIRANNFFHRMQQLIEEADAYIALPGGLGTLAELAMSWDLLAIHVLEPRPLIFYGGMWRPILEQLQANLILSVDEAFSLTRVCMYPDEVVQALAAPSCRMD